MFTCSSHKHLKSAFYSRLEFYFDVFGTVGFNVNLVKDDSFPSLKVGKVQQVAFCF